MIAKTGRVLVIRRRALGDLIVSLPAIEALARSFPEAELDLALDPPWVEAARAWLPRVRVIAFPDRSVGRGLTRLEALWWFAARLARERYDLVVDLHSTPQTALLTWWTRAPRRLGYDLPGRSWAYTERLPRPGSDLGPDGRPVYVGDALLAFAARARRSPVSASPRRGPGERPAGRELRVAIAPGATWSAKAWPAEHYRELVRGLVEEGAARVTVLWGPGEEALARAVACGIAGVEVAPPGTVIDLADRLAGCDLLVSGDSGARHLAIHLGVPTLSLFGPTDPWTQTPPGSAHRWLRYPIACAPCQRTTCVLSQNHCLARVRPEEVLRQALREVRARCA